MWILYRDQCSGSLTSPLGHGLNPTIAQSIKQRIEQLLIGGILYSGTVLNSSTCYNFLKLMPLIIKLIIRLGMEKSVQKMRPSVLRYTSLFQKNLRSIKVSQGMVCTIQFHSHINHCGRRFLQQADENSATHKVAQKLWKTLSQTSRSCQTGFPKAVCA